MTAVPVTARTARVLPAVSASLVLVGFAAAVVVLALIVRDRVWSEVPATLLPVPWLVAAALAVRARPDHPGALLFLGLGVGHLTAFALAEPVSLSHALGWGPWTVNTVATVLYFGGFAALGMFLATYPSGVPATRVVRWFVRLVVVLTPVSAIAAQLFSARVVLVSQGGRDTLPPPPGLPLAHLSLPFVVVGPLAVVVGMVLLVVRGRRAGGDERRRLSWAVGAAGLLALMLVSTPAVGAISPTLQTVTFFSVVSVIPFVLLAGLVRYRLMDVDLYVARTLARGVVVVVVLTVFAVVTDRVGTAEGAVAAAIVAVVAALTGMPSVRLLERQVDRWLSGGRVRGQALLRRLSEELVAPSRADQARRTAETVRASLDASWVRLSAEGGLAVVTGQVPAGAEPEVVVPLVAGDAAVGRLECGPRHGAWGPTEVAEVGLLARHVGLALHNSDLTERLARQVEELEASRSRIVRAELGVRQQLERDLHDGVQQQVVALIAHLGALKVLLGPGSREALVAQTALDQAQATLSELRQVVEGVQPPVLVDQGLVAAVASRAALLPLPVDVTRGESGRRWSADVEAAAYYVVSETLTNVVKHAAATRASVCVEGGPAELVVTVRDDGRGIPVGASGSGLAGLRDRVEALRGRFEVGPGEAGTGTTVRVSLPDVVPDGVAR